MQISSASLFNTVNYSKLNSNDSSVGLFDKDQQDKNISKSKFTFESSMQHMRLRFKSIKNIFLIVIIIAFLSLFYLKRSTSDIENNILSSDSSIVYSIVIDAGSTGSRIHVFRLNHFNSKTSHDKFDIKLVNEDLLLKVKPGLSSYAKEPEKAVDSIKPLLDKALDIIPKHHQKLTRISLKATAGLRLISEKIANQILNNIKKLFHGYPFLFNESKDDVSILDGKYEGIYSWLTLNYAIKGYIESRTCSLDLGGGSTQVTFVPNEQITLITASRDDLVDFKLDQNSYKIFSKSYLGYGLMSARMNIFKFDVFRMLKVKNTNKSNELFSVCLPPKHSSTWTQQDVEYNLLGPENNEHHSFEKCSFNVIKTLENKMNAPVELRNKDIYAFSFYFDRLMMAKIFNDSTGGVLKIKDILEKAISICDAPDSAENKNIDKTDKEYHFLCMDLTYIYSILTIGYGLPNDKEINVHNEVNKMEISWALGAAFHMLND